MGLRRRSPNFWLATCDQEFCLRVRTCLNSVKEAPGEFSWEIHLLRTHGAPQYAGPQQPDVFFLDLDSLQGDRVELVGEIVQVFDRSSDCF